MFNKLRKLPLYAFSSLLLAFSAPLTASAYVVDNTDDAGVGSLRYGVESTVDSDITFNPVNNGSPYNVTSGPITVNRTVTITGNGATNTAITGDGSSGIFQVTGGGNLTLNDVTVTGGDAGLGSGGAINNAGSTTVNNTAITGNEAESGAGIYSSGGSLTINSSTIDHNTAGFGGGLFVTGGTLDITNSTISTNTANFFVAFGGGIYLTTNVSGMVTNVTIAFNQADGFIGSGGGVYLDNVQECESDVSARFIGDCQPVGVVNFVNTIISNNTAAFTLPSPGSETNDCNVLLTSLGDNLDTDNDCFNHATDRHGDPNLYPLDYYGGPTKTHAIDQNSLAFNNDPCMVGVDQRGFPRPSGGGCDIGAFEFQLAAGGGVVPTGGSSDATFDGGGDAGLPDAGPSAALTLALILAGGGLYYGRKYA